MSEYNNESHKYDDIIHLPHYQSATRSHMSLHDRAAQFAPFAALTGHEEAIEETARVTQDAIILDESAIGKINEQLQLIAQNMDKKWPVSITYFQPDAHKSGGAYLTDAGVVKKVEPIEQVVILESGIRIRMDKIVAVNINSD